MEIVLEEAKNYGGYKEGNTVETKTKSVNITILTKRIQSTYFSIKNEATNSKSNPGDISWCAVFASWCLQQAGYANPSSCRALEFNPSYHHDPKKPDRLSGMRRISKPTYGCIIVWKNISGGGGHVAFFYGMTSDGYIIPLGGNQGDSLQFSKRHPDGDYKQKVLGYFLPNDYEDNPEDEFTKEELSLDPVQLNKSDLLAKHGQISGKT